MASLEDNTIIIYSLIFWGIMISLLGYRFRLNIYAWAAFLRKPLLKHLSYRPVIRSQRFNMQWSRADVLAEFIYAGLNVSWVCFRATSLNAAGRRAANLCTANLIFLCVAPHLDVLTNTLGLRWRIVRRLHGSVGVMVALLLIFHVIAFAFSRSSFPVGKAENTWAIVGAACIGLSVVICVPILRNRWYEAFLRAHQCLVAVSVYGIWVHVISQPQLPRFYIYTLVGSAGVSTVLLCALIVHRNGMFRTKIPRADIMHSKGTVLVRVTLSRPIRVKAGQYISLWLFVPSTSIRSIIQYHPFVVANWSDAPLDTLDLLIEPRTGFTGQLLHRSRARQDHCRALFSGPHGNSVPVGDYEVVLMVASGYGIAAQLPYLKLLLREYNSRKAQSRRIHLVWELSTLDLAMAIQPLLNNALNDDTLDDGYILQISVYVENVDNERKLSRRAEVIKGLPDWYSIVSGEVTGKYIKRVQEEASTRGDMIVTVSASARIRRDLQDIVQKYIDDRVELVELDYQPQ